MDDPGDGIHHVGEFDTHFRSSANAALSTEHRASNAIISVCRSLVQLLRLGLAARLFRVVLCILLCQPTPATYLSSIDLFS